MSTYFRTGQLNIKKQHFYAAFFVPVAYGQ